MENKEEKILCNGVDVTGTKAGELIGKLLDSELFGNILESRSDVSKLAKKLTLLATIEKCFKEDNNKELSKELPDTFKSLEKQIDELTHNSDKEIKEAAEMLIDQVKDDTDAIGHIRDLYNNKSCFPYFSSDQCKNLMKNIFPEKFTNKDNDKKIMKDLEEMLFKDMQETAEKEGRTLYPPKKAMISQPMTGVPIEKVRAVRNEAIKYLTEEGFDVVNTFFENLFDDTEEYKLEGYKHMPIFYLAKALKKMSRCDAVYFCKGWEKSKGCRIEHMVAAAYGLQIIYEDYDQDAQIRH